MTVTRFAPSPTGRLHLGHAYSAWFGWDAARRAGGRFLLRIEDIDHTRCKAEYIDGIFDDLRWLGLLWDGDVRRQSEHMDEYREALRKLEALGVLYPCFCTRTEIAAEIRRSGAAPHGPDGPIYPGTCRALSPEQRASRLAGGPPYALRLDVSRALHLAGTPPWFRDRARGRVAADPLPLGDVVLARKEVPASYHLAVTVDDAVQGVTLVTRGEDLFHATHIHRLLQALLGLPVPDYHHHGLIHDERGVRLAKRDRAQTLLALRDGGASAAEILARIETGGREAPRQKELPRAGTHD